MSENSPPTGGGNWWGDDADTVEQPSWQSPVPQQPQQHYAPPQLPPQAGGQGQYGGPTQQFQQPTQYHGYQPKPKVGGWGFMIFFFGILGGLIGYLSLKGNDPARARHVMKWGAIVAAISVAVLTVVYFIVIAFVLVAADDIANSIETYDGYTESTYDDTYSTSDTSSGYTAKRSLSVDDPVGTWTIVGSTDTGYSAKATVTVGRPEKIATDLTQLLACSGDATVDAIVPVTITYENTSPGFSAAMELQIDASYVGGAISLEGDNEYTAENVCKSNGRLYGAQWKEPEVSGGSNSDDFYVVVHNYYTPANPAGDLESWQGVTFTPGFRLGATSDAYAAATITSISGGAANERSFYPGGVAPESNGF